MSEIIYNTELPRQKFNDEYSDMLRESSQYFASKGISMTSHQGMEEILSESTLFEDYKEHLCEGLDASQSEELSRLFDNTRKGILTEANVSGIQQIAGLAMPTIRKMWAKVSLKHAIPTQVVTTPRFAISYSKPYLMDSKGNKYELPDAINSLDNNRAEMPKINAEITLPAFEQDLFSDVIFGGKIDSTWEKGAFDTLDKQFYLEEVTVLGTKIAEAVAAGSDAELKTAISGKTLDDVTIRLHTKTDLSANIQKKISIPVQVTDTVTGIPEVFGEIVDIIFATVDYTAGTVTIKAYNDYVATATISTKVSQETNEYGESVSFDILTKDVNIPVGTHINAPLPIEWLQDTMAIYNIDGAAEVIDLMSQTVAQKLEIEIYNFLNNSLEVNNIQYRYEFNMIPSHGYAGTPKMWREELKTVIDYAANKMKKDCKFHSGKFMIIGSPVDTAVITNVDWTFNHTDSTIGGVDVSFNIGAFSGANKYEIVASDLIPDGKLIMFFVPGVDRLMTFKYYPYTFNVEKGYRDPNMPNVPSIMMTKRHTLEEFSPLICDITIKNNVGTVPATPGY